MDSKSTQYIEQELVISTATNSADKSNFDFLEDNTIQFDNGDKVANTLSTNFLGFEDFDIQRVMGNYHCGTDHSLYELQNEISKFLATEETLVLGSYEGLCAEIMEVLLNTEDVVIYDAAMSAPLRRGVKYCQAEKLRYPHNDMAKLEEQLKLSQLKRLRLIVTDGIFFDSGNCANLKEIRQLAVQYDAIVIIDDSYGFLTAGKNGKGSDAHCGISGFQDLKIVNMQNALCCHADQGPSTLRNTHEGRIQVQHPGGGHRLLHYRTPNRQGKRHVALPRPIGDVFKSRKIDNGISQSISKLQLYSKTNEKK